jgi:hypothetical protein
MKSPDDKIGAALMPGLCGPGGETAEIFESGHRFF